MKPMGVLLLSVWFVLSLACLQGCGQVENNKPSVQSDHTETGGKTAPYRIVQHQLQVTLHPEQGELEVRDTLESAAEHLPGDHSRRYQSLPL